MTTCADRQRDPTTAEHHLAASEWFKRERIWTKVGVTLPITIASAAPIVATAWPQTDVVVAATLGVLALFARLLAKPAAEVAHQRGVVELEARDCHVFNLPWNHFLAEPPEQEATHRMSERRRRKHPEEVQAVAEWYEFGAASIAESKQVLVAQRSNLAWARHDHERWATAVLSLLAILVIGGIGLALISGTTLLQYLGLVAFPSVPGWSDLWDTHRDQRRVIGRKLALRKRISAELPNPDPEPEALRGLQDDVFNSRLTSPYVPQLLYKISRAENDRAMRSAARKLLS